MAQDLLLEIGAEELPASFVSQAVAALPNLVTSELSQLRVTVGNLWVSGTPRRLVVIAKNLAEVQADLDETVTGPSARAAFSADGSPTKAAEAFAAKLGCSVAQLTRVSTPKGEYVAGHRREAGKPTTEILPAMLARICAAIPFRKSMRWGEGETAFGRPVRWLLALFGTQVIEFEFAGLKSSNTTEGHRFLDRAPRAVAKPSDYVEQLRARHVIVDIEERKQSMVTRLHTAAVALGGELIEDDFLVEENCNLVEDPQIVAGSFEEAFLMLPERVILNVARGHQRYFGVRAASGALMPRYLAVVGTAQNPANVQRGNDRVMRARLADARFFYTTDLEKPLPTRREQLNGVIFHKRLGSVGDKVRRLERLVGRLGEQLKLDAGVTRAAVEAAGLAKCDLVTLMVGELPELQGEIGAVYAAKQGIAPAVAAAICEHYQPRGADDPTAPSDAGALLALADRFDSLVGCFAIGQVPTGTQDPLALRRATLGILRTLFDKRWDLDLAPAIRAAYEGFAEVKLDSDMATTEQRLLGFIRDRLKGLLPQPPDVIDACLDAAAGRPLDARQRAESLVQMKEEVRARVGEVFKRAANIAKDAGNQPLRAPSEVCDDVHASELGLYDGWQALQVKLSTPKQGADYAAALQAIAEFAPVLDRFFNDVFVMVEDVSVRNNRLSLMRDIHRGCSKIANFGLLAAK